MSSVLKKRGIIILIFLFLLVLTTVSYAQDANRVVSNSEDWRDVYSVVRYGLLTGKDYNFLTSTKHGPVLATQMPKTSIMLISSESVPFAIGYENYLESQGFPDVEEFEYESANLELANLLPDDVVNFLVIDDSYGYNAVSVAPYVGAKRGYVLFADKNNIDEVVDYLNDRTINELLVYGIVDRQVRDGLDQFNPIVISLGDRFDDNIEIVKKYRADVSPVKQIIMSNGEFIEQEIMSGVEPVLFIGRQSVPQQVKDYVKSTDISVAVLIGNELVSTATNIRREVGISTFVKFAQGARTRTGPVAAVEALDMFYLPSYTLNLAIDSIRYNRAMDQLEVTYRNNADVATYLLGTITVTDEDGGSVRVGDVEPLFINANSFKTVVYGGIGLNGDDLKAVVQTLFGDSKKSLEFMLEGTFDITVVDIIDSCEIEIEGVLYHFAKDKFLIEVSNPSDVDCYTTLEIVDLKVGYDTLTLGTEEIGYVSAGGTTTFEIFAELEDSDLERNKFIDLVAYYGQRETALTKILRGKFELKFKKFDVAYFVVISVIIILILLLMLLILRRRKEEERNF